jgi:hypothetical protein
MIGMDPCPSGLQQRIRQQSSASFVVGQGATTTAYPGRYAAEEQRSPAAKEAEGC